MLKIMGVVIGFFLILFAGIVGYIYYQISQNTYDSIPVYEETSKFPNYPALNVKGKTPEEAKQILRGELLVKAGDCITCHSNTLENGQAFAGGLPIQTPYGVIYTSNITPSKQYGIGQWQDADFIKAMREGTSPNGSYYYPAFPFLYFNKITTEDLLAIKAYLNVIPSAEKQNRQNKMIWPFGWRFIQLGWRILFFHNTKPYKVDPQKSSEWNQGAYLVEGLGHCGMCHTPSHYLFTEKFTLAAPIQKYYLSGAYTQGYLAPDISKSALDDVPDQELLKIFTQYQKIGGGQLHGPMVEAVHNSLLYLPKKDLLSIIEYLKSIKSNLTSISPLKKTNYGKNVYKLHCSVCHDVGVNGAPKLGNPRNWNHLLNSGMDKLYDIAIHGNASMPAKGGCTGCSEEAIKAAVDYLVGCSTQQHDLCH